MPVPGCAKEGNQMNNHTKEARRLTNEGMGCLGMISEVKSKAMLLKSKLRRANQLGEMTEELEAQAQESLHQMRRDLAKYSRRLKQICEELREYGIIPKLD